MSTVISLHANETLQHLIAAHIGAVADTRVLNADDITDPKAADTVFKACRTLVFDSDLWHKQAELVIKAASRCALRPFLICIGEIDKNAALTPHHLIKRPFKFGALLDIIGQTLSTSLQNVYATRIDCAPFGHVDLSAKSWNAADGGEISLTDKEIMLLYALSTTQSGPVEKSVLYRAVWGFDEELETHTLETHIYRLRRKIEPDPQNPCIIKTYNDRYALINHEAC